MTPSINDQSIGNAPFFSTADEDPNDLGLLADRFTEYLDDLGVRYEPINPGEIDNEDPAVNASCWVKIYLPNSAIDTDV